MLRWKAAVGGLVWLRKWFGSDTVELKPSWRKQEALPLSVHVTLRGDCSWLWGSWDQQKLAPEQMDTSEIHVLFLAAGRKLIEKPA